MRVYSELRTASSGLRGEHATLVFTRAENINRHGTEWTDLVETLSEGEIVSGRIVEVGVAKNRGLFGGSTEYFRHELSRDVSFTTEVQWWPERDDVDCMTTNLSNEIRAALREEIEPLEAEFARAAGSHNPDRTHGALCEVVLSEESTP